MKPPALYLLAILIFPSWLGAVVAKAQEPLPLPPLAAEASRTLRAAPLPLDPAMKALPAVVKTRRSPYASVLAARATILLSPQARLAIADSKSSATLSFNDNVPSLTIRLAEQCRALLEKESIPAKIVSSGEAAISAEDAANLINAEKPQALVLIRVDISPSPAEEGFRLLTMHEKLDPQAQAYRRGQISGMLPPECAYFPYQIDSMNLARALERGLAPAKAGAPKTKILHAPLRAMKYADTASLCVVLGNWNNPAERERLQQKQFQNETAKALADAIVRFSRSLAGPPEE